MKYIQLIFTSEKTYCQSKLGHLFRPYNNTTTSFGNGIIFFLPTENKTLFLWAKARGIHLKEKDLLLSPLINHIDGLMLVSLMTRETCAAAWYAR